MRVVREDSQIVRALVDFLSINDDFEIRVVGDCPGVGELVETQTEATRSDNGIRVLDEVIQMVCGQMAHAFGNYRMDDGLFDTLPARSDIVC